MPKSTIEDHIARGVTFDREHISNFAECIRIQMEGVFADFPDLLDHTADDESFGDYRSGTVTPPDWSESPTHAVAVMYVSMGEGQNAQTFEIRITPA